MQLVLDSECVRSCPLWNWETFDIHQYSTASICSTVILINDRSSIKVSAEQNFSTWHQLCYRLLPMTVCPSVLNKIDLLTVRDSWNPWKCNLKVGAVNAQLTVPHDMQGQWPIKHIARFNQSSDTVITDNYRMYYRLQSRQRNTYGRFSLRFEIPDSLSSRFFQACQWHTSLLSPICIEKKQTKNMPLTPNDN